MLKRKCETIEFEVGVGKMMIGGLQLSNLNSMKLAYQTLVSSDYLAWPWLFCEYLKKNKKNTSKMAQKDHY